MASFCEARSSAWKYEPYRGKKRLSYKLISENPRLIDRNPIFAVTLVFAVIASYGNC